MNIGMIRQHDHFQDKQGPLTEKEIEFIKKHPEEGVQLLKQAGIDHSDWLTYVLQHHENEDGSGYPHGLRGQEISQNAKIISLADRYCARVTGRTYRQPLLPSAALRGLFVEESKTIDTHLAPYFIHELGTYPPGTYVRLQNGGDRCGHPQGQAGIGTGSTCAGRAAGRTAGFSDSARYCKRTFRHSRSGLSESGECPFQHAASMGKRSQAMNQPDPS